MRKNHLRTPDGLLRLLPLFLFIGALPLLTHWVKGQLPSFLNPDPGGGTCSASGGSGGCPTGACPPTPSWQELAVATNHAKFEFMEFYENPDLPLSAKPKYYLRMECDGEESTLQTYYGDWIGYGWNSATHYVEETYVSMGGFTKCVHVAGRPAGEVTTTYSGSQTNGDSQEVFGVWAIPGVYDTNTMEWDTNIYPSFATNFSSTSVTNAADGSWDNGPPSFAFLGWGISFEGSRTLTHTSDIRVAPPGYDSWNYDVTDSTEDPPQFYHWTSTYSGTTKVILTNEYTTAMLLDDTVGLLPPYATNASAWGEGEFHAYVRTTDDTDTQAEARKFKFRVVFDSKTNHNYKITWTVNGGSDPGPKTNTVAGTGQTMIVPLAEYVPSAQYPDISVSPGGLEEIPVNVPGSGTPQLSSFGLRMGLGSAGHVKGAGELAVHQERPSAAIATPATLGFVGLTNDVEIISDGSNWIRQAKAPQTLADVVTITNNAYEVRFYAATNAGVLTNGLYVPTGSPFVVWGVSGSTNTNFFRITETRGASVITNDFEWAETNQSWTLTSGNGLRREVRSEVWSSTNTVRTITHSILRPSDNALIAKSVEVSQQFPFGLHVVTNSIGDDAATRTTTYSYYTSAANDGDNYGKLKTTVHPDGSWQWHEYNSAKRLAKTFSAFGNQSPTNSAALCRVTEFDYEPVGTGDAGTVQYWQPRTTIEKLLGIEIGRSYAVYKTNETSLIKCQTAGSAWDASDNLVSTTTTYSTGSFKGWTKSERRPDGTLSLHEYSVDGSGNLSTLVWSGQPNGGGTAIVAGTKLVTLRGPLGNVIERTTVDIASTIITGSETFSDFDEFGRPGRVTYLDSTFKLFSYLCCGLESETDRDGVTTTYGYDALKRRITTTRNSIAHIQTLDAANRVLMVQRQGTNASVITLVSSVFDTAGEKLFETNAVGKVTSFGLSVDGSGQTVRAVTNALGATVITTSFKDRSVKSITGTGTHGVRYEYGIESDLPYTKVIKLKDDGSDSGEWRKTFQDMEDRPFKTVFPDSAYVQSWFNDQGQLWKQRDADGVVTLRQYNGLAELEYEAVDMDRNDTIDFAGTDRITRTVRRVGTAASLSSVNAFIAEKWVFTTDGATNTVLAVLSESAVDGTARAQTTFGLTNRSYHACGGACASTNFAADGSYAVTLKTNGYLVSVARYDAGNAQLSATTYTYDEHGRQKTIIDARNGTTTLIYDDASRVTSATTPAPGGGQSAQTTTTYYDDVGNVWRVVKPDGTSVTNEFYLTREFKKKYGSQTYPEERTWDYAGRPKTLKTWQDFAGNTGTAVTTWNYSTNRGFMLSKQYQDGNGPSYTWTPGGKLETRTWARGVVTSNSFNNAMDLVAVDYSDSTPDVALTYDRRGRQTSASASAYAVTNYLTDASQLLSESWTAGPLSGLAVTNSYDAYLRRTNLAVDAFNLSTRYTYDAASRLASVGDGTNTTTYAYLANSALIEHLAFLQNSTVRMATTNRYDYLNRLTGVASVPSSDSAVSFDYAYNDANQRVAVTNADSSRWSWGYDSLGQVTSGKRYWSDSTIVAGQQFEYAFDSIGNRTSASSGGSQFGTSLRTATYGANLLNQYTNRTVPGYVEVQGSANSNATVTVNNESTYRKGAYFRKELNVANSSAAVWQGITNIAVLNYGGTTGEDIVTTKTGNVLVPKTPEVSTYDADGNLTQDGRWVYAWDAENRLVSMTSLTNLPSASRLKLEFAYDNKWRRIQKVVSTWDGSAYVAQSTNRFLYDGWNLAAMLDGNGTLLQSFQWGTDMSGSFQGAGGVGGLKAMTIHAGTNVGTYFFAYDANGNVMALVSASNGGKVVSYEYGPFGEMLRASGPLGALNTFRFSTKFCDDESGLFYYGYRYYDPSTGRWPNRDPIEELGGVNCYNLLSNSPVSLFDFLGLCDCEQLRADIQRFENTRRKLLNMFANWQPGETYSDYGLRPVAGATGYRSDNFSRLSSCAQEEVNAIEANNALTTMNLLQLVIIGGVGYYTFGGHGVIHGTSADEQLMITSITIEASRTTLLINRLRARLQSECCPRYNRFEVRPIP